MKYMIRWFERPQGSPAEGLPSRVLSASNSGYCLTVSGLRALAPG
jgi:hypothetical protein